MALGTQHDSPSVSARCSVVSKLFVTPWTIACQAPLTRGFSRQEYWSGLPFHFLGDLPDPGIRPRDQTQVSCIADRFFTISATGKSEECFMELASSWEPVTLETLPWESSHSDSLLSFGCKMQTLQVMQWGTKC